MSQIFLCNESDPLTIYSTVVFDCSCAFVDIKHCAYLTVHDDDDDDDDDDTMHVHVVLFSVFLCFYFMYCFLFVL